jgi:hypothetical protein
VFTNQGCIYYKFYTALRQSSHLILSYHEKLYEYFRRSYYVLNVSNRKLPNSSPTPTPTCPSPAAYIIRYFWVKVWSCLCLNIHTLWVASDGVSTVIIFHGPRLRYKVNKRPTARDNCSLQGRYKFYHTPIRIHKYLVPKSSLNNLRRMSYSIMSFYLYWKILKCYNYTIELPNSMHRCC